MRSTIVAILCLPGTWYVFNALKNKRRASSDDWMLYLAGIVFAAVFAKAILDQLILLFG